MIIQVALDATFDPYPSQKIAEYDSWKDVENNWKRDLNNAKRIAKDQGRVIGTRCMLVANVQSNRPADAYTTGLNDAYTQFIL